MSEVIPCSDFLCDVSFEARALKFDRPYWDTPFTFADVL